MPCRPHADPSRRRRAATAVVAGSLAIAAAACSSPRGAPAPTTARPPAVSPLLAVPATGDPATGPVGPLRAPGGPFLEDRYGRAALVHGVDLVYKVPPYEVEVTGSGPNVLTADEARQMAALGFDVVRLGVIWKGLEPGRVGIDDPAICDPGAPRSSGPGQFNAGAFEAYLGKLDATVALLGHYGIYSLIDMHQDVYSDVFGGEGAPDWAVCTDGAKPAPQRGVPDWSVNLRGPGVVAAYTHFWKNDVVGDLQGEFDAVWAKVAAHFRTDPYVIGYDPFNEPYGAGLPPNGNGAAFDADLECLYTGRAHPGRSQAGKTVSCPPHDPAVGLVPRIEAADPNHLVFYEGNYTTDSGPLNHIGPMALPGLVLNFHDYCFLHVPNGPEPPDFASVCAPSEKLVFTEHAAQRADDVSAQQPRGPAWLLTEFGATTDAADLARITSDADGALVGWIYWQWLHYDDPTGSHTSGLWPPTAPVPAMLEVLARTYASAVAGVPTVSAFDPPSGRFLLQYRADPAITEPTVIVVPLATHYPAGYCARVSGGARITSPPGAADIDVHNGATASTVTVTVAAGHC
ncbi:MAG TPA: cellulase family glycosylhydrolase [Acidimicrobiales bacterium]|nr:cellulase family glycosylhydrolase [Acidimicrobiales bacterium]